MLRTERPRGCCAIISTDGRSPRYRTIAEERGAVVLLGALPETGLDTYEVERRPNAAFYTNLALQLGCVIKQEASPAEIAAMNSVPEGLVTPHEPPPTLSSSGVWAWERGPIRSSRPARFAGQVAQRSQALATLPSREQTPARSHWMSR
jgi:hypothetical protein